MKSVTLRFAPGKLGQQTLSKEQNDKQSDATKLIIVIQSAT